MQKNMRMIGTAAVLLLIVVIVLAFRIHEFNNPVIHPSNEEIQQEFGVPVEVATVELRDITNLVVYTGTVEGFSETDVVSDVSQNIIALKVRVGSHVSPRDTIAVLDTKSVSNMNLRYAPTAMNYRNAKLNFDRMKNLYEAGAISKQAFDQAKLSYDIEKSNYDAVVSSVYIPSPIAGIVTAIYVDPGNRINSGQPVAKVVRFDKVKIKIQVNESDIARLQNGQDCIVSTASFGQEFHGKISEIALSADPRSRNFAVTVVVDNPDLLLRSGMFAKVKVVFASRNKVLAVPKETLIRSGDSTFVYTVSGDKSVKKSVTVGATDGQYYEVLDGLIAGERVVIEGYNKIQNENQKVVVVE